MIRIGLIGAGFSARFHLESYRKVYGCEFEVAGIASRDPARAAELAKHFGIAKVYADPAELLRDDSIHMVDLCVPNHLHVPLVLDAAAHGKHIICEKPLGGYFGPAGAPDDWSAKDWPRQTMLDAIVEQITEVETAIKRAGVTFCYAENWVYAPPIVKLDRLMAASQSTILRIEGEESHSGSHAPYSRRWRTAGGGSLLRLCVHPIGAALHLKYEEGRRRDGKPIRPVAVRAQVANLSEIGSFQREEPKHIVTGWQDVEDFATVIVTFDDGSVAQLTSTDTRMGGIRNFLSAFGSRAVVTANINPNTTCQAYTPDGAYFDSEYIVEKTETKGGWSFPAPDEDAVTGYPEELRDFVSAVQQGRAPRSDLLLAMDVLMLVYAGYCSAAEGREVDLRPYLAR
jgi:predicted dehydrogenase